MVWLIDLVAKNGSCMWKKRTGRLVEPESPPPTFLSAPATEGGRQKLAQTGAKGSLELVESKQS